MDEINTLKVFENLKFKLYKIVTNLKVIILVVDHSAV